MPNPLNPLNPLEWLRSAQDWFARTERSSGFRPYLIFMIVSFGAGLMLVSLFPSRSLVEIVGLTLLLIPVVAFVPLYAWKARSDPDFCRSERHIQKIRRMELEVMGSESRQIEGEVIEQRSLTSSIKETPALSFPSEGDDKE